MYKTDKTTDPPTFITERLIMRPFEIKDAEAVFAYASDEENTRYMLWERHRTIEDTLTFINWELENYKKGNCYDYAFVLKETGAVIGSGGSMTVNPPHSAEIGYIIDKKYWGRGLVPEAMAALIDYYISELKIRRIEAKHFLENEKSGRVMLKLGMRYEGLLRQKVYAQGRYWDVRQYALINEGTPVTGQKA